MVRRLDKEYCRLYHANGGDNNNSIEIEAVNDISHLPLVNEPIVNDVIKRRYLADLM